MPYILTYFRYVILAEFCYFFHHCNLKYTVYCLYFILCVYNNSIVQIKTSFPYVSITKNDSCDDKNIVLNETP